MKNIITIALALVLLLSLNTPGFSQGAAEWPDNQFTKLIEKPNAGTFKKFYG